MIRKPPARHRTIAGAIAYAALCAFVASAAWVATGTVIAGGPSHPGTTSTPSAAASFDSTPLPIGSPVDGYPVALATPRYPKGPTAKPATTMAPFEMDIYRPNTFVSQINHYTCMAAAIQNMLNIRGPKIDRSTARQIEISTLLTKNTAAIPGDSKNGGYGPEGWAVTLTELGMGRYKMLIRNSMQQAIDDAAWYLRLTGRPVGLLTWWGAHSWVMTGFQSDGDPRYFPKTFHVNGAMIVDPFYPRISSIWGQTIGPDIFRDWYAMQHNYIGWKRPEGHYPDRDGKWLLVVPY